MDNLEVVKALNENDLEDSGITILRRVQEKKMQLQID